MILFAWRRLTPPAFIGGAEKTEAQIALHLSALGHSVRMIGSYENPRNHHDSAFAWLTEALTAHGVPFDVDGAGVVRYQFGGVECLCAPQDALDKFIDEALPQATSVWTTQEGSADIGRRVPRDILAAYVHSVSAVGLEVLAASPRWLFAPSQFVANVLKANGRSDAHVLRPPFEIPLATMHTQNPARVLFVNPVPEKGVVLALALARLLPQIPFEFVEGWRPVEDVEASEWPRNVIVTKRVIDLEEQYSRASVVIVPSLVDDAAPRVVLEAAAMGVPAIGSNRGGIPELVAQAASIIAPDDTESWSQRLGVLLSNPDEYGEARRSQLQHLESLYPNVEAILAFAGWHA